MDFDAVLQQEFPAGQHPRLCIERVEIDGRICVVARGADETSTKHRRPLLRLYESPTMAVHLSRCPTPPAEGHATGVHLHLPSQKRRTNASIKHFLANELCANTMQNEPVQIKRSMHAKPAFLLRLYALCTPAATVAVNTARCAESARSSYRTNEDGDRGCCSGCGRLVVFVF